MSNKTLLRKEKESVVVCLRSERHKSLPQTLRKTLSQPTLVMPYQAMLRLNCAALEIGTRDIKVGLPPLDYTG